MKFLQHLFVASFAFLVMPFNSHSQERYGETEEQQTLCKEAVNIYKDYK